MVNHLYTYVAPVMRGPFSYPKELGYVDENGNFFLREMPLESKRCIGYVAKGRVEADPYMPKCDMCVYVDEGGIIFNHAKQVGHIDADGKIYDDNNRSVGHVEGKKIIDDRDLFYSEPIGESEVEDLRVGAALLLGLFDGVCSSSQVNENALTRTKFGEVTGHASGSEKSGSGSGSGPSSSNNSSGSISEPTPTHDIKFGLCLVLGVLVLLAGILLLAAVKAVIHATYSELGPGFLVWVKLGITVFIPAIMITIILLNAFYGKKGVHEGKRPAAYITVVFIAILSGLLGLMLPYTCEPFWYLWKFGDPSSIFFYLYWAFRLAYAIIVAVQINRCDWEIVRSLRHYNIWTGVLMIFQLVVWCLISHIESRNPNEEMQFMLFAPVIIILWLLTNIPIRVVVKRL